jgi:hypothetical protein
MDEMSDDDEVYGDTDPNTLPAVDDGQGASAGDGLPGYPVDGHPDWRAGVPRSGNGVLGMARVSDLVARPGQGDARMTPVSDPVLEWEQNSWRWNDPEAIAYDLDRKQRQLAEAKTVGNAAGIVGLGQRGLAKIKPTTGIGVATSLPATVAATGVGLYMHKVEAPRIEEEIKALQSRLNQLRGAVGV